MDAGPPPLLPGGNLLHEPRDGDPSSRTSAWRWSTRCSSPATITVGTVLFCTLAGFAFAKLRFRGRDVAARAHDRHDDDPAAAGRRPAVLRSWPTSGWPGPLPAVILPTLVTAFGVFFMRQYLLQALPDELIEAARVDGATVAAHRVERRAPDRPARHGRARDAHVRDGLERLLLAGHRAQLAPTRPSRSRSTRSAAATSPTSRDHGGRRCVGTLPVLVVFVLLGRQIVGGIMPAPSRDDPA